MLKEESILSQYAKFGGQGAFTELSFKLPHKSLILYADLIDNSGISKTAAICSSISRLKVFATQMQVFIIEATCLVVVFCYLY